MPKTPEINDEFMEGLSFVVKRSQDQGISQYNLEHIEQQMNSIEEIMKDDEARIVGVTMLLGQIPRELVVGYQAKQYDLKYARNVIARVIFLAEKYEEDVNKFLMETKCWRVHLGIYNSRLNDKKWWLGSSY